MTLERDVTRATSPSIQYSSRCSLPLLVWNLAPRYTFCVGLKPNWSGSTESHLGEDLIVFWTDCETLSEEPFGRGARRGMSTAGALPGLDASWPFTDVMHMELRELGQLYGVSVMDDLQ